MEQFLAQSAKAVVLVESRPCLYQQCNHNRTLEITCGRVEDYKNTMSMWCSSERREQQLRAYENQGKWPISRISLPSVSTYKPTKAVQVQSRIKQLEKIVPIEVDEVDTSRCNLFKVPCLRSGDYPIICDEVKGLRRTHRASTM